MVFYVILVIFLMTLFISKSTNTAISGLFLVHPFVNHSNKSLVPTS
jgi:hypothetical protein